MLKVLIVDDEPLAREHLRTLLQTDPRVEVTAEACHAVEAMSLIHKFRPDVVLLDIQMPRISGLEMLKMLDPANMPYIVFVTAYDNYAIQAFEEHAFDYLLKPITQQRLGKTLQRLAELRPSQDFTALSSQNEKLTVIPCSGRNRIYLINCSNILYINSRLTSVVVVLQDRSEYVTEFTLKFLEQRTSLISCHRQYLLNLTHLKEIHFDEQGGANAIFAPQLTIPISRRYLKSLKEQLGFKR